MVVARQYHDPTTEADVHDVYAQQERLTRKVARGMLAFAIVWIPALVMVPEVFDTGAVVSLSMATVAALACMVIMEHFWLKPRSEAKWRYGYRPPPPRDYQSPVGRLLRDARSHLQK